MHSKSSLLILLYLLCCISCGENDLDSPGQTNLEIVNLSDQWHGLESHAYSFSAHTGRYRLESSGNSDLIPFVKYSVSVHRFTYQTTFKGNVVTASGAIAIPIGKQNPSIMVYHHGTMFNDDDTPSMQKHISSWGMELPASNGFIVFIPDYIGYGTTAEIIHPYHLYRPAVDASIDMIVAGKEFLKENNITFHDDGIFLAGFSEGGYDAFAVQKEIESNPGLNIKIKASAPGAGAYDVDYQFRVTTATDIYPGPGYMGMALSAYNDYYFQKPLTYFFLPEFADRIPDLISGKYAEAYVHRQLPERLSLFIDPEFLEAYRSGSDPVFADLLNENNVNNFNVQSPTRFIHGTADAVVPFPVAEKSYHDLLEQGTSSDVLELYSFTSGHDSMKYLKLMMEWFNSMEAE
ncbi:MAG TPA: alpha/beta hydrolase [Ohtaekwangia sp.]